MATKRFGARYGKRVRDRLKSIEAADVKTQLCPYCRKPKVKRLSIGIFQCSKCKAKFTGKAYSLRKRTIRTRQAADIAPEQLQEDNLDIPKEKEELKVHEEPDKDEKEAD